MKLLYFLLLLLSGFTIHAQTCTIKISYDDKGNRILRELECLSPRQQDDNPDAPVFYNRKSKMADSTDIAKGSFAVYPNPASNEIYVELDALSLQQNCSVALIDQLGREHFRKEQVGVGTSISLAHLPDGLYHILLIRGTEQTAIKIVKEAYNSNR